MAVLTISTNKPDVIKQIFEEYLPNKQFKLKNYTYTNDNYQICIRNISSDVGEKWCIRITSPYKTADVDIELPDGTFINIESFS